MILMTLVHKRWGIIIPLLTGRVNRVRLSSESQLITTASASDMPEEMRRVKEFIEKTFQGTLLIY